jgi:DNA-binding MarR family transcriptional regulator
MPKAALKQDPPTVANLIAAEHAAMQKKMRGKLTRPQQIECLRRFRTTIMTLVSRLTVRPVQITHKEWVILNVLLKSGRPCFGREILRATGKGFALGSLQVTLQRMEVKEFITSQQEKAGLPGIPRRFYKVTKLGKAMHKGMQDW